jgi:hypothetical protein
LSNDAVQDYPDTAPAESLSRRRDVAGVSGKRFSHMSRPCVAAHHAESLYKCALPLHTSSQCTAGECTVTVAERPVLLHRVEVERTLAQQAERDGDGKQTPD